MTTDLQQRREEVEIPYHEPTFMEVIAAASRDPQVDISKMKELLAMKERIDAQAASTAFNVAMRDAQAEIPAVLRDSQNEHTRSRYAKLEAIDAQIRPIYTRHGFSLSFNSPTTDDSGVTVSCTAFHASGHSRDYQLSGSLDGAGSQGKSNKTNIQALGSTVTYLRRYLTCMIFNVVLTNEDNDGNVGKSATAITQEQADNVECLISELGLDPKALTNFLTIMEAKTVREIKADRYRQAMTLLQAKRRSAQ